MKLDDKYYMNLIAEKDAEIKRLNDTIKDLSYYHGLYVGKCVPDIILDEETQEMIDNIG